MNNHPHLMLSEWYPQRDQLAWVLGSVVATHGSSYRKAGAMMMFNELGGMCGLLSGGCVEKSLFRQVKQVLATNQPVATQFDASAEAQIAWQMGLGCGGVIDVQLQPVTVANQYQQLPHLLASLDQHRAVCYGISLRGQTNQYSPHRCATSADFLWTTITPRRHLVIFGGGVDAVPLVRLAFDLDWQVSVVEHRPGYAQDALFNSHGRCYRVQPDHPDVKNLLASADAAIVMSHNITVDADALRQIYPSAVRYIGLLGPEHRKQRVLQQAGLHADPRLYGPMGLALGGDLPEAIALSALAQCHQILTASEQQAANPVCIRAKRA